MDLLKLFFELITLIILIVLIVIFILAIVDSQLNKDHQYMIYTSDIAQIFQNEMNNLLIPDYDLEYIPVYVVEKNNAYIDMFKCSYNINSESPTIPLWNVSNNNGIYLFAPDLSSCTLLDQVSIGSCNNRNFNIYIRALGGDAGYIAVPDKNAASALPTNLYILYTSVTLTSPLYLASDLIQNVYQNILGEFQSSDNVYVYNQTNIECSCNGCTINGQQLTCYLQYGNKNIETCAELFGLMIPSQQSSTFFTTVFGQDILTVNGLSIGQNTYPYLSLVLGQFINKPLLLIRSGSNGIYFYYELPVKNS